MINKTEKREVKRAIEKLRRNPPKVTPQDHAHAQRLLDQNKKFEESKDRDIERERKALAKDVAGFVHTQFNGVGTLFHGFGEGKKALCSICEQHESQMHNMNDGQWYCSEHRWFGNLSKEQQKKERVCLSQKKN